MSQEFVRVGKIKSAHGLRGELFVLIFSGEWDWLADVDMFRLTDEKGTHHSDLQLKFAKAHKSGLRVGVEGVNNRNDSEALCGLMIEIPADLFVTEEGETPYLREFLDFEVISELQSLGRVTGFVNLALQDLLVVEKGGEKFEIPFVDAYIEKIEKEERQIYLNLPEGLLELNKKPSRK